MRAKLFAICLAVLSLQTVYAAEKKIGKTYYVWPIFFGGATFFFSGDGPDAHYPGYSLSGGVSASLATRFATFFTDVLYSYRAYDGFPESVHYRIEETSGDLAIAVMPWQPFYVGGYIQLFPINTKIRVKEWTLDDFNGISRSPSFSIMGGARLMGKYFGLDARLLLGPGPGFFLGRRELGDHWIGQISVGITGGF